MNFQLNLLNKQHKMPPTMKPKEFNVFKPKPQRAIAPTIGKEHQMVTLVSFALILLGLWQFMSATPSALIHSTQNFVDLDGVWTVCLHKDNGIKECKDLEIPADIPKDIRPGKSEWLSYTRNFIKPTFCGSLGNSMCSLFASEVGDSAEVILNGTRIGIHGNIFPNVRYAKQYPLSIQIPDLAFKEGSNKLELKVYSLKKVQSGIRKAPISIMPSDVAHRLSVTLIFQRTIIPLIASSIILLIILTTIAVIFIYNIRSKRLLALLAYCVASGMFLISFSDMPREYLNLNLAGPAHYFLRTLMDYTLLILISSTFCTNNRLFKILHFIYIPTLTILFMQFPLSYVFNEHKYEYYVGFDGAFTFSSYLFPFVILPLILGLYYSLKNSAIEGYGFIIIFCTALIMQTSDRMVMYQVIQQPYYGKLFPLSVALAFAIKLWSDFILDLNRIKTDAVVGQRSTQVAHDIRSPLSALEHISSQLGELSEDKRIVIRNSINRIRDIANSLTHNNVKAIENLQVNLDHSKTAAQFELLEVTLLQPILELMVTEKRIENRGTIGVSINFQQSRASYGLFSIINVREFKRVISNLVNNSIEALPNSNGNVDIILQEHIAGGIQILISDTGKGIPKDLISQLGVRGKTFNKPGGTGLGLAHAKHTMEGLGGFMLIDSCENRGTTISLNLKKENAPNWFVPKLEINQDTRIIVFDDDQTIHQIWKGRIESVSTKEPRLIIEHISTTHEFRKFFGRHFAELESAIFLMDYEIAGASETGLDLIEQLGIQSQSILVTSRYEEPSIRDRCQRLGVSLIPKSMSGFVPIEIT